MTRCLFGSMVRRRCQPDRVRRQRGKQTGRRGVGDGEVPEKSLEMRHFQASRIWRSQGRPLPGVPLEEVGKKAPMGAVGSIIMPARKPKRKFALNSIFAAPTQPVYDMAVKTAQGRNSALRQSEHSLTMGVIQEQVLRVAPENLRNVLLGGEHVQPWR